MSKKNILVQTGTRIETRTRMIPDVDEEGHYLGEKEETYEVTVPVMEQQTVDMTEEETAELEAMQATMPEPTPTPEERIAELEQIISDQDDALAELAALIEGE